MLFVHFTVTLHCYTELQSLPSVATLRSFSFHSCISAAPFSQPTQITTPSPTIIVRHTHQDFLTPKPSHQNSRHRNVTTANATFQHGRRPTTRKAAQVSDHSHSKCILEYTDCLDMTSKTLSTSSSAKSLLRNVSPSTITS